jgi:hypothetical protein
LPVNEGTHGYHYSWAQILAKRILNLAVRGEAWAVSEISRLTEPVHSRLMGGGFDNGDGAQSGEVIRVEFVGSDGSGRPCREFLEAHHDFVVDGETIEGEVAKPALPSSSE